MAEKVTIIEIPIFPSHNGETLHAVTLQCIVLDRLAVEAGALEITEQQLFFFSAQTNSIVVSSHPYCFNAINQKEHVFLPPICKLLISCLLVCPLVIGKARQ